MAPEIFRDRPYSASADIWALGVVLYEMATKRHAFEAQSMAELMRKVMAANYRPLPHTCSEQMRNLCGSMLLVDHRRRPSTGDMLRSPYVKKHLSRYPGTWTACLACARNPTTPLIRPFCASLSLCS